MKKPQYHPSCVKRQNLSELWKLPSILLIQSIQSASIFMTSNCRQISYRNQVTAKWLHFTGWLDKLDFQSEKSILYKCSECLAFSASIWITAEIVLNCLWKSKNGSRIVMLYRSTLQFVKAFSKVPMCPRLADGGDWWTIKTTLSLNDFLQ